MTVTLHIAAALREFTARSSTVEIQSPGQTLTDALAALWMKHRGIRDRVPKEQDQIRQHINIFVGNQNVRYTGALPTQVPQQSQISIVPAVSGGSSQLAIRARRRN